MIQTINHPEYPNMRTYKNVKLCIKHDDKKQIPTFIISANESLCFYNPDSGDQVFKNIEFLHMDDKQIIFNTITTKRDDFACDFNSIDETYGELSESDMTFNQKTQKYEASGTLTRTFAITQVFSIIGASVRVVNERLSSSFTKDK